LVLCGDFYSDEWFVYPDRKHAKMAQIITEFNPIKYFVEVIRMVQLKGSGLADILPQLLKTLAYAMVMNVLAVWSYKKVN